jgi:hypothetical protein
MGLVKTGIFMPTYTDLTVTDAQCSSGKQADLVCLPLLTSKRVAAIQMLPTILFMTDRTN